MWELTLPATTDRLWGPKMIETIKNEIPGICSRLKCAAILIAATGYIEILCTPVIVPKRIIRLVVGLVLCSVSFDFSADGRRAAFQYACYFSKR